MTKLERLLQYNALPKHKNGGQLKNIEVAEEQSVIPEGALHKELNHLDELEGAITRKGINVISIEGEADTYQEIIDKKDTIVTSAEIEREEIIFSKELTDYIEEARKEWHETNSNDILEEVGKRVTKELLFNTDDRVGLIEEIKS
jgi:hypothetical protein